MAVKVTITGPVGNLKTETLMKIIDMLRENGKEVQGLLMNEITEKGKVRGYSIYDIYSKRKVNFADAQIVSRTKIEKIGVDSKLLDEVLIPSLERARENADVIVIDEIGKLDHLSKGSQDEIEKTLKSNKPLLMTIHKKSRNPVLQEIRALEDVRVFDVTPINKNILPYRIMKVLLGEDGDL